MFSVNVLIDVFLAASYGTTRGVYSSVTDYEMNFILCLL